MPPGVEKGRPGVRVPAEGGRKGGIRTKYVPHERDRSRRVPVKIS